MNRGDFYNDKRKERRINFLEDYRVVSKYICRKHDMSRGDLEFLFKLHGMGTFIKKDFENSKGIISWDAERWFNMLTDGTIVVYRERKPSLGRNYKIYTISRKAKTIVEDCYKILCGELDIPEAPRYNPIMKEETYSDKKYAEAIRMFNKARKNLD